MCLGSTLLEIVQLGCHGVDVSDSVVVNEDTIIPSDLQDLYLSPSYSNNFYLHLLSMATATPNPVDQIIDNEDRDAIRFTWNAWPASSVEAKKHLVVPLACVYSPLRKGANGTYSVQYEPIACRGPCRSILNPFWFVCENITIFLLITCSSVDLRGKLWVCPFCFQRNHFPAQYAEISESLLPAELQCTTIEYVLPHRTAAPPAFLLVVDTCLPEDELKVLKESLIQLLGLIPRNALIGLITFGTMVSFLKGRTFCDH